LIGDQPTVPRTFYPKISGKWYSEAMSVKKPKKTAKVKTGPKPELYKIEGNWQDAVKKSLLKKKPAGGWPK